MAAKGSDDIAARELKPNVFLALQVQSPVIHQRLIETAGKILDYDEKLAEALEAVEKSHITLLGLFFVCKQTGKVCKVADDSEFSAGGESWLSFLTRLKNYIV